MREEFFSLVFLFSVLSPFAFAHSNLGIPMEYADAFWISAFGRRENILEGQSVKKFRRFPCGVLEAKFMP